VSGGALTSQWHETAAAAAAATAAAAAAEAAIRTNHTYSSRLSIHPDIAGLSVASSGVGNWAEVCGDDY